MIFLLMVSQFKVQIHWKSNWKIMKRLDLTSEFVFFLYLFTMIHSLLDWLFKVKGCQYPRSLGFRFQGIRTHLTIRFCAFSKTLWCLVILFLPFVASHYLFPSLGTQRLNVFLRMRNHIQIAGNRISGKVPGS